MAHFQTFCKALKIDRIRKDLKSEKENSIKIAKAETPKWTLKQRYRHFWIDCGLKLRKCCSLPERSWLHRCCYKLSHNGSLPNFLLKSVLGLFGGFVLTYLFFLFFVVLLDFGLATATVMCAIFGTILIIGLAFSKQIRCIVFLTLPQFFSKKGRQALLAYAFILAITGPARNTLNNMGILTESMACGQEQLKSAVRQIIETIKKPFYAIRDAIKSVVKTVKIVVQKIKEILMKIKRIIMAILKVIKAAFQFLGKILNICNKELGTPFQRCARVFDNAITDCNAKLGPLFSWLCSLTYLVKSICYIVKIFDYVCMLVDFISDSVIGVVVRKVKTFIRHIRTMFYVRIKFSHSFQFNTNSSKTYSEVAEGIVTELKERTAWIVVIFEFMNLMASFFFLFLVVKVIHYRYKFLTSERFDNNYITKDFRAVDLQRAKHGKETILPLNHRERKIYITMSSCRLIPKEKTKLLNNLVVLLVASIKLGSYMLIDFSLWWVLNLIRKYGKFQSKVQAPNMATVKVEGHGLLADLLKSVVKAFRPFGTELEIDTVPCLPNPIPPDYDRYIQIVSILGLCWLLTLVEPYGLRLRHWIMCYYQPLRAKQRSVWLYNHIMRARMSFFKFARRQLRRKMMGRKDITHVTCSEFLKAKLNCKVCRILGCLGADLQDACILCGEVFREDDPIKPIRCQTPDCPGIFCQECFADLKNLCTVCLSPVEYGDLSDFSEEKGSTDSDDERNRTKKEAISPKSSKDSKKSKYSKRSIKSSSSAKSDRLKKKYYKESKQVSDGETERLLHAQDTSDSEETGGVSDVSKHSVSSSDHSYSYQYKKPTRPSAVEYQKGSFEDLEMQNLPDYVSMANFRHFVTSTSSDNDAEEEKGKSGHPSKCHKRIKRLRDRRFRKNNRRQDNVKMKDESKPLLGEKVDKAVGTAPKKSVGTTMSGLRFPKIGNLKNKNRN